jgi:hypothetical protein
MEVRRGGHDEGEDRIKGQLGESKKSKTVIRKTTGTLEKVDSSHARKGTERAGGNLLQEDMVI